MPYGQTSMTQDIPQGQISCCYRRPYYSLRSATRCMPLKNTYAVLTRHILKRPVSKGSWSSIHHRYGHSLNFVAVLTPQNIHRAYQIADRANRTVHRTKFAPIGRFCESNLVTVFAETSSSLQPCPQRFLPLSASLVRLTNC
jgi:hypothetical protein